MWPEATCLPLTVCAWVPCFPLADPGQYDAAAAPAAAPAAAQVQEAAKPAGSAQAPQAAPPAPSAAPGSVPEGAPTTVSELKGRTEPFKSMQAAIAKNMVQGLKV